MADLIAAPATAVIEAPRAIIRISGDKALAFGQTHLQLSLSPELPRVERVELSTRLGVLPLEVWLSGEGRSFTGEESLELHLPSSPILIDLLLEILRDAGVRDADAGEFTRRAYLNGRLDLVQAEAVMAMVSSIDAAGAERARRLLEGSFSKRISRFVSELEMLCARFEVAFDFDEEAAEQVDEDRFTKQLSSVAKALGEIRKRGFPAQSERLRVALVGATNVGKSTLFNALLGQERAAVADEEGTTRDHVNEETAIQGLAIELVDCAGLLEHADGIDAAAIASAKEVAASADLVLAVIPCSDDGAALVEVVASLRKKGASVLILRSKADLSEAQSLDPALADLPSMPLATLSGEGIKELRLAIVEVLRRRLMPDALPVSARAAGKIHHADDCLQQALEALQSGMPLEVASDMARAALAELRDFLGNQEGGSVLDIIFASFCIGK